MVTRVGMMAAKFAGKKALGRLAARGGRRVTRRRRRGLDAKLKSDLIWLRANIGKTAAANYLAGKVR